MGASLAFLRYTDCEHPGKVNRFLDRKGSANKVFNLKDELGPRQEWRRKLQEMVRARAAFAWAHWAGLTAAPSSWRGCRARALAC
jgi:hypothetical protein